MRFLVVVLLFFSSLLHAQVLLVPVGANPGLPEFEYPMMKAEPSFLLLPFVDDFSNYEGFPDATLWADREAFVNKHYPVYPPTVGVATLDALDAQGVPYAHASTSSFYADTLTSLPIRLDSLTGTQPRKLSPDDSVFFSFYYQPGGGYGKEWERIGTTPGRHDSLILDFYDALSETWHTVWKVGGISLDTLYARTSSFFQYVHIPVVDSRFFQKGFRFRFRNIATLPNTSSPYFRNDGGQWHIDYVVLDRNRSAEKYSQKDIAFVQPPPSFINGYQSIPARQFQTSDMKDHISLTLVNLHEDALSSHYKYEILDKNNHILHTYDGGVENIAPFLPNHTYQTVSNHATPPVNYVFPIEGNTPVSFKIRHLFQQGVSPDHRPQNDTAIFTQVFDNYFAYDDGSAENGFGIVPIQDGRLAISYSLRVPDTLTAVDIYFNATTENNADNLFNIIIYSSKNGLPHHEIFRSEALSPQCEAQRNKFHRYVLPHGVVLPAGEFFVALKQLTPAFMNLGFDRNNNAAEKIFFNTSGEWEGVFLKGAVMLRPCFGQSATLGLAHAEKHNPFAIYPIPTKGTLYFNDIPSFSDYRVAVKDLYGQELRNIPLQNNIDLSDLPDGIYLIYIYSSRYHEQHIRKVILSK